MVAAATSPQPDQCEHAAPVRGVMATEFAHYDGAQGPEGKRRTVTFYGPVVGGLPIMAWHCENCGLLKLDYPDGRHEERRMYPGPQPGLLRASSDLDPDVVAYGRQARVSGMSVSPELAGELESEHIVVSRTTWWARRGHDLRNLGQAFYALNGWSQLAVVLFAATLLGLFTIGTLAVYTYSTPKATIGIMIAATLVCFAGGFLALLAPAVFPLPHLSPAPADAEERTSMAPALRTAVGLLATAIVLGFVAAVLAVYDYATSSFEAWFVLFTIFFFSLGFTITVTHILNRIVMPIARNMAVSATTCITLAFSCLWAGGLMDYTGMHTQIGFITLDALLAVAGGILTLITALLYAVPTSLSDDDRSGRSAA